MTRLQIVVELPEFQKRAKAIMQEQERKAAIDYIAANPEAGVGLGGDCARSASRGRAAARVVDSGRSVCLAERICRYF